MKAIILGAGYGTRLYPLTKNKPKPLLPIGSKPILERIIENILTADEIDEIFIVSNDKFYNAYLQWVETFNASINISIINDETTSNDNRLGAVGDIKFVIDKKNIKDDVMIIAGDNLLGFDVKDFVRFAAEKNNGAFIGLKDIKNPENANKYSIVEMDDNSKILDFEEKPPFPKTSIISIGLYLFPKDTLHLINEYINKGHNPDAPGYYMEWLVKNVDVFGYLISGYWYDIGDIDSYHAANSLFEGD